MGRGGFGILAACMFVSIEGSFWASSSADASHAVIIFVVSALFMAVVSVSATAGPRRVSLSFAYRWMCPLMVAGFAAIIVLGTKTGAFAAAGMDAAVGAGAGAATGAGAAVDVDTVDAAGAAGEAKAGRLVLRPQSVRGTGGEGEGAAGETGVSAPVAIGASPSAISSQNPQPVDFIGQRVALLAREHKLTSRETEVFGLLAHGRSIPYVRDALIISRDTAATHAKHIYAKLDVHSRQELIDLVMSDEL